MKFTIVIAKHDTERDTARYDDFVVALGDALIALGHEVTGFEDPGRLIAFNINNVFDPDRQLPEDAILFNTEQAAAVSYPENVMTNYRENQNRVIWDYSETNAQVLRDKLGMKRVVVCPVGYFPSMTRIKPAPEEDIDVLFYGAMTIRRVALLDELVSKGLSVKRFYGIYGAERDTWISRAKVVLNLHYGFERGAVFEIFRVSHLLANKKCVVSESGSVDEELGQFASRATLYVAKGELVDACKVMVSNAGARRIQAERGFEEFKKTSLVENVRRALELS